MVEIASQMQHLARNAEALAANVDQTSASIQQMSVDADPDRAERGGASARGGDAPRARWGR